MLVRKGRLQLGEQRGPVWIAEALAKSPVHEAPITYDVAVAAKSLCLTIGTQQIVLLLRRRKFGRLH